MENYLAEVFSSSGYFAQAWPEYKPRRPQIDFASAVDRAIREQNGLLADCPCGTGKSFGYLVPASWHVTVGAQNILARRPPRDDEAADDPQPVPKALIVTANIALQEQLVKKDIPALQKVLPWKFTAAVAKGRSNFACLDRCAEVDVDSLFADDKLHWKDVIAWSNATTTGDLTELPFVPSGALRQRLTISSDDCIRKECPHYKECWAEKAKKKWQGANILVANYHLLFAHFALVKDFGPEAGLLPHFDFVIMDEAHEAADVVREMFGLRVSSGMVKHVSRFLQRTLKAKHSVPALDEKLAHKLTTSNNSFFRNLDEYRKSNQYYAHVKPNAVQCESIVEALLSTSKTYNDAASNPDIDKRDVAHLKRASARAHTLADEIKAGVTGLAENLVPFLEEEKNGSTVLCGKLIHTGDIMNELLFSEGKVTVATSATISTGGADGFEFAMNELGAHSATFLETPSPFDFQRQCVLVVPDNLPDPKAQDFDQLIAPFTAYAAEWARGRTLVLCTSNRQVKASAECIRNALGDRYKVFVQGEAPVRQLVASFTADTSSILVGTKSLWAGVDVPGEALSCVVIVKLPFEPPTDPIVAALGSKAFAMRSLPLAKIALRQGFGRLIRSVDDRGAVVILDRRLLESNYGRSILDALPDARRVRNLDAIRKLVGREPVLLPPSSELPALPE